MNGRSSHRSSRPPIPLDPRTGDAIVTARRDTSDTSPDGRLLILDGRPAILRVVSLQNPSAVLVSEATERVFVINDEDIAWTNDAWHWLPRWVRQKVPFLPQSPSVGILPASVTVLDLSRLMQTRR